MDGIDDTDREILRLLLADARRPYSDIAERVDLSGPAVSDRVERLRERGVIRGFTVDLDRSKLRRGRPLLVTARVDPAATDAVEAALIDHEAVEHVFATADARITVTATVEDAAVTDLFEAAGVLDAIAEFDVRVLADATWSPSVDGAEFAPTCAECDNTVDDEGVARTLDGDRHYFCCESCEANFVERYERIKRDAES